MTFESQGSVQPSIQSDQNGSAVVDFVLSSFALIAIFVSAAGIITNLYLRTVLTNAATDAARLMARADVSSGCVDQGSTAANGKTVGTAVGTAVGTTAGTTVGTTAGTTEATTVSPAEGTTLAARAAAIERARQSTQLLVGEKLLIQISAHTEKTEGFCTAVVTIGASLPGLPLTTNITNFEATAHATLELQ